MKTAKMSPQQMHRKIVEHMHHGILFTCKEKRSPEVSRKQIELEKFILSVVIQTQKDKHWILFLLEAPSSKSSGMNT